MTDEPAVPAVPVYAAALIERADNRVLIARLPDSPRGDRVWVFPRGSVEGGEPPEAALRRTLETQLGVQVEIVVGQPPLRVELAGREVELRYFFCGILSGELRAGPYAETRFSSRAHLAEYELDEASAPVADWLQEGG